MPKLLDPFNCSVITGTIVYVILSVNYMTDALFNEQDVGVIIAGCYRGYTSNSYITVYIN